MTIGFRKHEHFYDRVLSCTVIARSEATWQSVSQTLQVSECFRKSACTGETDCRKVYCPTKKRTDCHTSLRTGSQWHTRMEAGCGAREATLGCASVRTGSHTRPQAGARERSRAKRGSSREGMTAFLEHLQEICSCLSTPIIKIGICECVV